MPRIQPIGLEQSKWKLSFQLDNFHTVANNDQYHLFRSARPSFQGLIDARNIKGVKTVISLENDQAVIDRERGMCQQLGLNFISRPMSADGFQDDNYIQETVRIVADAARKGGTLVHCYEGRDRTGIICAEFETEVEHKTANQAATTWMEDGYHRQQGLESYYLWKHPETDRAEFE